MGAMPPEERREVVESLRAELNPPAGVDADLAGPVVTAAAGEDDVATSMWLVTLLALVAVALLLAVLSRSIEAALLVVIPLTLAAGWAFLVLFLLPVDVDFLTAALGAIVVAICAGPAVLAARGYRDARAGGLAADVAVEQLRRRPGGHAVAFGAVAVGGFLALTVCDIPALRDLGAAGAVSLPLCGLGMAVSLPATLVWADRRGGLRVPRTRAELGAAGRSFAGSMGAAVRARRVRLATARPPSAEVSRRRAARCGPWWPRADEAAVNERPDPFADDEREREAAEARRAARPYSIAVGIVFLGVIAVRRDQRGAKQRRGRTGPGDGATNPAVRGAHLDRPARRRREHRPGRGRERQAPRVGLPGEGVTG